MRSFVVTFLALAALFIFFWVGLFALQPALTLGWLCFSVPVAFFTGRASVAAFQGRRLAIVRDDPYRMKMK